MKNRTFIHLITITLLSCSTRESTTDNFQGTLIYSQDIVVPQKFVDMGTTREKLMTMMKQEGLWADTVTIMYDGAGNYRLSMNNNQKVYKIYLADSNKIYTFVQTPEMVQCIIQEAVEYDINTQSPVLSKMLPVDTTVTINGATCTTIRMGSTQSTVDYYYDSTQLKVNPALYSRHRIEGFADYFMKARSLPLGMRRRNGGIELVQTLTKVKPGAVREELFRIPALEEDSSLNVFRMPGVEVRRVSGER